jgi:Zn-dependent protease with chaperone function
MAKTKLKGLQALAYEHPFDRRALESLSGTPGLEHLVRAFYQYGIERFLKIRYTGSNLRVTRDSFPEIYDMVHEGCDVLDLSFVPDLYIEEGGTVNAFTSGVEKPILVLNTRCIDSLTNDELFFVIGHELGHIKSGHVLFHEIGSLLPFVSQLLTSGIPFGEWLTTAIEIALLNWKRMSELTADRAGLLACQNRDAAIGAMVKIAGLPHKYYSRLNADDFIAQAREFKSLDENPLDRIAKALSILGESHPWTVLRAAEFDTWTTNGGYNRILDAYTGDKADAPRFCPHCGTGLIGDETFCPVCGRSLIARPLTASTPATVAAGAPAGPAAAGTTQLRS